MDTSVGSVKPHACLDSPVNRLPVDVLLDIFLLVIEDTSTHYRYKRLDQLMLVCSQWKALSVAPSLWTHVSNERSLSAIKDLLFRSQDAPLDVVFNSYSSKSPLQWSVRTETDDLLLENIYRWRSFEFRQHGMHGSAKATSLDVAFIHSLCHLTVPNLNSLTLTSMNRMSLEIPFTSKPIRLHHLSVQACSIPWDSCLFSELKTLELHRLEKKGPSLDQFIDFLHASPDLVRLTLWEWNLQGTIVTNYSDIITLQSLETFEMSDITCHVAEHLLAILRIPVCTRFRLINDNHSDCKLFSLSMEHLFPTLRAIMASCGDTEVTLHKLGLTVTSCKRRKRILIIKLSTGAAPPDWQTVMSERLRNLLGSTTAIPALHLQISTNIEEFLPTVSPLVGSSCTIEELILTQEGPDPTISDKLGRVLALLSKPREVDGVTRWPLPNLRSLIIQHDTWMEKEPLFNMVRNRYADHEPGHERPAKLQSLRIESGSKGSDKGFPPMMRSILGPRVVKYGSRKPTTRYYED